MRSRTLPAWCACGWLLPMAVAAVLAWAAWAPAATAGTCTCAGQRMRAPRRGRCTCAGPARDGTRTPPDVSGGTGATAAGRDGGQLRHDLHGTAQPGTFRGVPGGRQHVTAHGLVQPGDFARAGHTAADEQPGGGDKRIPGLGRGDVRGTAVRGFRVGAGVPHQAVDAQVQEGGLAALSHPGGGFGRRLVDPGWIASVGGEVLQARTVASVSRMGSCPGT